MKLLIDYIKAGSDQKKDDKDQKKKETDKQNGNAKSWGVSISGKYETKTEEYSYHEDEIEVTNSESKGGTFHPDPKNADNAELNRWLNSVSESNSELIDFMRKGMLPIYVFISDKALAEVVRQAWLYYCKKYSLIVDVAEKGTQDLRINVRGTSDGVVKWKDNSQDFDVYATVGRPIAWKLSVDVVNLEDKNQAALSIYYQVAEGRPDQIQSSPDNILQSTDRTNLCFVQVMPIGISRTAVDKDRVLPSGFSVSGVDSSGQTRINVTSIVEAAIRNQLTRTDIAAGRKCPILADRNHQVYVYLDGKGDDQTHIGYEFTASIPYLKYEN